MKNRLPQIGWIVGLVVCSVVVTAFFVGGASGQTSVSVGGKSAQYTIVETDGQLLIVTDNGSNTLYFYTIDEGGSPGDPLKLRGTVDLNQVGKPTIKPKLLQR